MHTLAKERLERLRREAEGMVNILRTLKEPSGSWQIDLALMIIELTEITLSLCDPEPEMPSINNGEAE